MPIAFASQSQNQCHMLKGWKNFLFSQYEMFIRSLARP